MRRLNREPNSGGMNERDDPTKAGLTAIIDIAKPLGIAVQDDIIVGRGGHASLKGMKLI